MPGGTMRAVILTAVSVAIALAALCAGEVAAHGREPASWTRCICVDGVPLELVQGSALGPPGRGRLDWPGADVVDRCRPEQLPVGALGEEAGPSVAKW